MSISILILLSTIIVFLTCFVYMEPILFKHKVRNNNEYGSARFSTESEINKNFTKERINNIKEVGFPVYYDKNVTCGTIRGGTGKCNSFQRKSKGISPTRR